MVFTVFSTRHGSRFQRACRHWCKFANKLSTPTRKSPTCPTRVDVSNIDYASVWDIIASVQSKVPDPVDTRSTGYLPWNPAPSRSTVSEETVQIPSRVRTPLNSAAVLETTLPSAAFNLKAKLESASAVCNYQQRSRPQRICR